jgi:hypothetical protein
MFPRLEPLHWIALALIVAGLGILAVILASCTTAGAPV